MIFSKLFSNFYLKRLSYRDLVTVLIFGSSLFILTIGIFAFSYWAKDTIQKSSKANAQSVISILSQDFVRIVLLGSTDAAVDMSAKLEAFSTLRYVEMYDAQGKFLFSYKHTKETNSFGNFNQPNSSPEKISNHHYKFEIPIRYQNKQYGKAYIVYSAHDAQRRIAEFYSYLYWSVPILLFASFLLALFLQKRISKPISIMAEIIQDTSGNNNFASRMDEQAKGELGILAQGYNQLMATIDHTQQQLHADNERLRVTLESIAEGVIATDINGTIEYLNPLAETLLNCTESDAIGKPLDTVFKLEYEKNNQVILDQLESCLINGEIKFNLDDIFLVVNDTRIPVQSSIAPIRDQDNKINGAVVVFRNVSHARELRKKLEYQASHDGLTDLFNRSEFEIRLDHMVNSSKLIQNHALVYLDLDQFKIVNDTCGHMAGDAMLRQLAGIIRNNVRDTDVVARLGGDEFGILLPQCTLILAKEIANKLLKVISEYSFKWDDKLFRVGASLGVVTISDKTVSYIDILKQADIACYAAKNLGRNRIHLYEPGDKELAKMYEEMQWVSHIEKAFDKGQFRLFVQKVVPCSDKKSSDKNSFESYEVLLRYMNDDGTICFPGTFLGSANRYGLMTRIDEWVIENLLNSSYAIDLIKKRGNFQFNVNISYTTLDNPSSIKAISDLVINSKFPATSLCFEFTETAASINVPATLKFMRKMKLLGCKFALDDFGSGLSSFGYLKNLPVDYIKIDGTLVKDIDNDKINYAMVESINHIGKVMGLKIIAEYVHSEEIYNLLQKIDVDYLQGYYIHRPMPIEEIEFESNTNKLLESIGH